jgi:hypothetical protein
VAAVDLAAANQPLDEHSHELLRRQVDATQLHVTRSAARSVVQAVEALRELRLSKPDKPVKWRWR